MLSLTSMHWSCSCGYSINVTSPMLLPWSTFLKQVCVCENSKRCNSTWVCVWLTGEGAVLDRSVYGDDVFASVCTKEGFISREGGWVWHMSLLFIIIDLKIPHCHVLFYLSSCRIWAIPVLEEALIRISAPSSHHHLPGRLTSVLLREAPY